MPVPGERDIASLGEIIKGVESPPRTTCVHFNITNEGDNCMQHTRSYEAHNGGDGVIPSEKERKKLHAAATTREPASITILDIFLVSILHGRAEDKEVTAPLDVRRYRAGCLLLVCPLTVNTGLRRLGNLWKGAHVFYDERPSEQSWNTSSPSYREIVHPYECICDSCLPCFPLDFDV